MLKIIATPPPPPQEPAKPENWLAQLLLAPPESDTTLDLSTLRDYLKTEDLEATAQELHSLLPETREIRWSLEDLELFLSVQPKTTRARILTEILSRHSQGVLSFADDSPSARECTPGHLPATTPALSLFFSFDPYYTT